MKALRLEGRTALVTGATRGLGHAIAAGLVEAGASRVFLGGRDQAALAAVAAALGTPAQPLPFDLTDSEAMAAAVDALPQLDILVLAAGVRDRRPVDSLDEAAFRALSEQLLIGPYALIRACLPQLRASPAGRIIAVTSIAGPIARAGDVGYTAAKGGLAALTRALAADLGRDGITVNAIAPGFFATAANRAMADDPEVAAHLARRTSLGRWGQPHEIAGAAVFLASDAAAYVTGHTLAVDGGYLSHF